MSYDPAPLSKTAKYKKITKPLLERKRRARINRCLDELKDLMVGALEIDDDNLSKLEKADILELTVNHITKLHSPKDPALEAKKFQAGFGQCAAEACRFIMSVPDLDAKVSQNLIGHLSRLVAAQPLTVQVPDRPPFSPPASPSSITSDRHHYYSDHDRSSSDAEDSYSIDGRKTWNSRSHRPEIPPTGLLTTVDKLPQNCHQYIDERRNDRLPRAPEAKETILQKIRQHIMDKRVNGHSNEEHNNLEKNYHEEPIQVYSQNDTLDLRKVRSPNKNREIPPTLKQSHHQGDDTEVLAEASAEVVAPTSTPTPTMVPQRHESQMDYKSLPPKKKRKLLEFQEHKRLEEAKRRDAYYEQKNVYLEGAPADADDGPAWRPW